jgi:hypothetical protein
MITRVAITSRIVLPVPPEQTWRAGAAGSG